MPTEANSINASVTGIVGNTGASFTATAATQYDVIVGGSTSSTLSNVAPSATAGVPLISSGSAANPTFGTAVVAGGGTGNTTFTAYSVLTAGTTATGAFQNVVGVGTSLQVLTSNDAAALPSWQTYTGGVIATINGDSGSITGSTVTIQTGVSTQNSGSSVQFVNSGTTSTLNVTDSNLNTLVGNIAGNATLSGTNNSGYGYKTGRALTSAANNCYFGFQSGDVATTSPTNCGFGSRTLNSNTTGSGLNVAIGYNCVSLTTGTSITQVYGSTIGGGYSSTEHGSNAFGCAGGSGNLNTTELGLAGTTTAVFIAGIAGATYSAGSPTPAFAYEDNTFRQFVAVLSVASSTVTTGYGSLVVGTGRKNNASYGILVNITMVITAATGATIVMGVGNNATPTTNTVVTTFSGAGTYTFQALVPAKYFLLVNTTGSPTVGSITTQACGM